MKKYSFYNVINIIGISICIIFLVLTFGLKDQKILFGVLLRGSFGLLMIYNAIYLLFTNGATLLVKKGQEKHRRLLGILILITGLMGFVTAVMGYGINGYPLLDWKTVF
jgi:uncharacterized membrane protein YfcA